jgi:hypothetical protein
MRGRGSSDRGGGARGGRGSGGRPGNFSPRGGAVRGGIGGDRGNFSPRGGAARGGVRGRFDGGDRGDDDDHGRGRAGRSPVAVQEWMRRIDGESTWAPLRLADNVQNDVAQIDDTINQVRGGALRPQPHHNPYRMQLSSGRMLTFEWRQEPSVHACHISNIKYNGKSRTSTLWHPKYDPKPR